MYFFEVVISILKKERGVSKRHIIVIGLKVSDQSENRRKKEDKLVFLISNIRSDIYVSAAAAAVCVHKKT